MKSLKICLFAAIALTSGSVMADYHVGDRVECNWKSGGKYYAGRVGAKEGSKLFINYDDGDKEHTTAAMCHPVASTLGEGSSVECRWKNGATWYPGVITEKTGNQVFINYNDGDAPDTLEVGSAVSCKWKGGGTWYPGVIAEKTGSKVFINYNDGDKEHTNLSMCRPR